MPISWARTQISWSMEVLSLLIVFPVAAFLIAAVFGAAAFARKRAVAGVVGVVWLAYGLYENLMYSRILCSGECDIRIDLLIIYPVLLCATIAGVVSAARRRH